MMRIAVPIHRKNYYRVLGPVIAEALRRGCRAECWHDLGHARRGGKASEFPDTLPASLRGAATVREFRGEADLIRQFRRDPPDVVVALDPPPALERPLAPTVWILLQSSADPLLYSTPDGILRADALAVYSADWVSKLGERFAGQTTAGQLGPRAVVVGMPELDVVAAIDPDEVRHRFGLPRTRPVVLYLPFPLRSNPPTFWLRKVFAPSSRIGSAAAVLVARRARYWEHVRRGWNDHRLVSEVRAFCDRHDAVLVMKARRKDPMPRYARRLADRALYDPSHYPPTILELLSVASLCVHAYSTAVFEAAYCGVPSLCLAPADDDMGLPEFARVFVHNGGIGGIYNWPGTAYCVPLCDTFDGFRRWGFADFPLDAAARKRYVERFLGFDDGRSSVRLVDEAVRLVERVPRGA